MPKISVNIPVYNDEKYIKETIKSVLAQTFNDYEIIIVDDGSTDKTAEIINSFNDPRIKYSYQNNQGIGAARNKALKESNGEYIAFLDHDDLWLPQKLEKQIALFKNNPELGLVFCDTTFFNEKGDMYSIYTEKKPPRGMVFDAMLSWYFLSCETVVIKKEVIDKIGEFPPHMMMAEEYDLFLRISYKYPIDYVDEPLAKYRIHEKNYSWGKELQAIKEEMETINRLTSFYPEVKIDCAAALEKKHKELELRKTLHFWKMGKRREAISILISMGINSPKRLILLIAIIFFKHSLFNKYFKNPFQK